MESCLAARGVFLVDKHARQQLLAALKKREASLFLLFELASEHHVPSTMPIAASSVDQGQFSNSGSSQSQDEEPVVRAVK